MTARQSGRESMFPSRAQICFMPTRDCSRMPSLHVSNYDVRGGYAYCAPCMIDMRQTSIIGSRSMVRFVHGIPPKATSCLCACTTVTPDGKLYCFDPAGEADGKPPGLVSLLGPLIPALSLLGCALPCLPVPVRLVDGTAPGACRAG